MVEILKGANKMTDYVIVGILIILIVIGIRSSVKHFKGEGGCCGGGSAVKVKRKNGYH